MKNSYEAYRLLEEDTASEENAELTSPQHRSSRIFPINYFLSILCIVIFISSIVVNIFLGYYITKLRQEIQRAGATKFG